MPTYSNTKYLSLPQQVSKNKNDIQALQGNQADISNLIPKTEKAAPLGVATLGADGKVPSAQLPTNSGNFLPLTGGTMQGDIILNGYNIWGVSGLETTVIFTDYINSSAGAIEVLQPLMMNNKKIMDTQKGTSTKDVATVDNINDHDTSPFAHADIRNSIAAIQGTYVYVGTINLTTDDVDDTALNNRVFAILGRTPLNGDVLVDNENGEWRFDGTNWVNLGHFDIALASALNDGLMTKEDFNKLNDLLNKADFDNLISTLATMDYLVNNYYNNAMVDAIETSLQEDIDTKEALANKATDFSVVDDIKYPTTKAVDDTFEIKLLDQESEIFGGQSFNEWFDSEQLFTNGDFSVGTTGWLQYPTLSSFTVNSGIASFLASSEFAGIYRTVTVVSGHKIYAVGRIKANGNVRFRNEDTYTQHSGSGNYELLSSIHTMTTTTYDVGVRDFRTSGWSQVDIDYLYAFNISTLITNKRYSPLYNTTFDLMTDTQIKIQMDEFVKTFQLFRDSSITAIIQELSNKASKTLEAWLTPTLTGATSTYIRYRKDTLGSVIVEGNITVGTAGTNFTLPTGYRPLFAYTVGNITFNTNGTVVSSATGTQTLSVRFTGGA